MEVTNESLKQCPECLEETEELVEFDGEQMCPECAEHFQNDRDERERAPDGAY